MTTICLVLVAVLSPISGDYYSENPTPLKEKPAVPSPISGDYYSTNIMEVNYDAAVPSPISGDYYSYPSRTSSP